MWNKIVCCRESTTIIGFWFSVRSFRALCAPFEPRLGAYTSLAYRRYGVWCIWTCDQPLSFKYNPGLLLHLCIRQWPKKRGSSSWRTQMQVYLNISSTISCAVYRPSGENNIDENRLKIWNTCLDFAFRYHDCRFDIIGSSVMVNVSYVNRTFSSFNKWVCRSIGMFVSFIN